MHITRFSPGNMSEGTRIPASWAALCQFLCHDPPAPRDVPKASLGLWSPATFRGDHRARLDVEAAHALGFDVDAVPVPSEDELRAVLSGAGQSAMFHCSSSHTPEAPRWRLLLELSRPITAEEYDVLWAGVSAALPFAVGREARDPSRGWYMPREPAEGAFVGVIVPGAPLDVDGLLPALRAAASPVNTPMAAGASIPSAVEARYAHVPRDFRVGLAREWLAKEPAAVAGANGSGATMRAIAGATRQFCLTSRDMVAEAVAAWNARCAPPWGGSEIEHKIDEALHKSSIPWNSANVDLKWALHSRAPVEHAAPEASHVPAARLTPAARALSIIGRDATRLATGFPTLDAATGGGIPTKKVVVIGGAPGAGKTAMLVRWAYAWLVSGAAVGILASDEDADGLLTRLGQLHGLSRDDIERGDPATCRALAAWCESVPLLLFDGDEPGGSIEALSHALREEANGRPSALLVDSIQTMRSDSQKPIGSDLRTKIDAHVRALNHAAKVHGHRVVASSELSRAAYRNKDQAENVNALSAFKESGGIEYGVALAIVLSSKQGTSELVDATVVKNRIRSPKPEFMLRLVHDSADVQETTLQEAKIVDPLYFMKIGIKSELAKACGGPLSKRQLAERVGGRTKNAFKAIGELLDKHDVHEDRGRGIRLPLPGDPGFVEQATAI